MTGGKKRPTGPEAFVLRAVPEEDPNIEVLYVEALGGLVMRDTEKDKVIATHECGPLPASQPSALMQLYEDIMKRHLYPDESV